MRARPIIAIFKKARWSHYEVGRFREIKHPAGDRD